MIERRKNNYTWLFITALAIASGIITYQINQLMQHQNEMVSDLSKVEYLSSSTQRLSRMIITGDKDNKLIFYIDEEVTKTLDATHPDSLTLLEDEVIADISREIITNWNTLYNHFQLPEGDPEATFDIDSITLASDNHFNSMTNLSVLITEESAKITDEIYRLQNISYVVLVLIVFFLCNYLISTTIDLRSSAALAALATLDASTGLFNRSKCQEILKSTVTINRDYQPAVVVIDLNDLKLTNDQQGHNVGDQLIIAFSKMLVEAANIHENKPFLGRYGGDEFVVYHAHVQREELDLFVGKLSDLVVAFNKTEQETFVVSYALGYAITESKDDRLSPLQLFEEADEKMYSDKREQKERKLNAEITKNKV
ncbi:MAG: diguanylate cyclase [Eubacteriales bacterium]